MIHRKKQFIEKFKILLILVTGLVLSGSVFAAEEKKQEKKEEKKEEVKPNVFSAAASKITFDGYFQLQFSTSSVDKKDDPTTPDKNEGVVQDSFEIRRARLGLRANFTDWIVGRLQIDAAASTAILRDAYLDLGFDPKFELRFGQFKKPFSRIQLLSSSVFPMIERGIRIRGVSQKALDNSLEDLKFSERDIGIMVFGNFKEAFGKDTGIGYQLAVVNGAGRNVVPDTNNGKLINGRINVIPVKGLELAVSVSNKTINGDPLAVSSTNVQAYGFDFQYRPDPNNGIWLIGEVDFADNFDPATGGFLRGDDTAHLFGVTGIVAYRYPITTNKRLIAIEPAFRVDFTDPDTDKNDNAATLITPGLNLYFHKSVRLMFNYDFVVFQDNRDTESAFQFRAQYIY